MNEYDSVLKLLFQRSAHRALSGLTGVVVSKWLNVELPRVQNPLVDLMGETLEGGLVHLELQSRNEAGMELRMAEYYLATFRLLGKFPRQYLVYVGREKLRMKDRLRSPGMSFRYRLVDIRELDGERLLGSADLGDNILAILTRLRSEVSAIRRILAKIEELVSGEREAAFRQLMIICGLRGLEEKVEEEAKKMPVHIDWRENKVLFREYKRGLQEGLTKGELALLRRLLQKRFGSLPNWAEERLSQISPTEIESIGLRLLEAKTLKELFGE